MTKLNLDTPDARESRYLLVDGAQCARTPRSLLSATWSAEAVALFDGVLPDGCHDVAPHLVRLRGADHTETAYRALLPHLTHAGAVTWLDSALAHGELLGRLGRRLHTVLPNGKQILLRTYDGRVLPHLAEVMTQVQHAQYFAVARRWWYFSPQLDWRFIHGTVSEGEPLHGSLALNTDQRGRLQDACYPYSLIDHFADTEPELLDNVPPDMRYVFFRDTITTAERYGLNTASDFVLFCTLALLEGKDFHTTPAWREQMTQIASSQRSLGEVYDEHYQEADTDVE